MKVRTRDECAWQASSNASWITITGRASGSGEDELRYRVAQNNSSEDRSGTLSIAGQSFSIRQRGAEPPREERVNLEGTVGSVGGSCPSLTIGVNGEIVRTDSSTKFKHGACSDVRSGVRVKVKGRRVGSEPIRADEVSLERR